MAFFKSIWALEITNRTLECPAGDQRPQERHPEGLGFCRSDRDFQSPFIGRSRNAFTYSSSAEQSRDTWLFEIPVMPGFSNTQADEIPVGFSHEHPVDHGRSVATRPLRVLG